MTDLRIATPCHEDWSAMTPTVGGRHCAACDHDVVDVSAMSAAEGRRFLTHIAALDATDTATPRICVRAHGDATGRIFAPSLRRRLLTNSLAGILAVAMAGCQGGGPADAPAVSDHGVAAQTATSDVHSGPEPQVIPVRKTPNDQHTPVLTAATPSAEPADVREQQAGPVAPTAAEAAAAQEQAELWDDVQAQIDTGSMMMESGQNAAAAHAFTLAEFRLEDPSITDGRRDGELGRVRALAQEAERRSEATPRVILGHIGRPRPVKPKPAEAPQDDPVPGKANG